MLLEMTIDRSERAFSIPPHGHLGSSSTFRLFCASLCALDEHNKCQLPLPTLMHLYATLKGHGLTTGDHSFCLSCSCKYSNEPSQVDSTRDNGSIFYLVLLVGDSWMYIVDCIVVSKSAWFAGINFTRHSLLRCACRGECLFIYSFFISIVILWCRGINWTASTAQQFKAQYIH